jgi:hypothetical protein
VSADAFNVLGGKHLTIADGVVKRSATVIRRVFGQEALQGSPAHAKACRRLLDGQRHVSLSDGCGTAAHRDRPRGAKGRAGLICSVIYLP